MSIEKPYGIGAVYYDGTVDPTVLKKPVRLTAVYDLDAGSTLQGFSLIGFNAQSFGNVRLTYKRSITFFGFNANVFGSASIKNKNEKIDLTPPWWQANRNLFTEYGYAKVELWKRYTYAWEFDASIFGTAKVLGGVKFVNVFGFNSNVIQPPLAINTKADQYANLNNHGIAPPLVSTPNVFPQILYAKQFIATQWGNPLVQFPPRPKGFDASLFGIAWISHSPRYLEPNYIDAFNSGYPKVFDPTQKIGVTGVNTVIAGGIFGDTSIRNTRRIIKVSGLYSQSFSDWGVVESNLRNIVHNGLDNQNFGSNAIWNKTPSITPIGINSFTGLNAAIGYRIRTIKPIGFYQPKFGTHILTKPPELKPGGIVQNAFGTTFISNHTRNILATISCICK